MTALIWMLTWLPHVLPHVLPAMTELPRPVNVSLSSTHFHHLLKWEPGPGTPSGVHYQVTMKTERGSSGMPVAGCERVEHPLLCNLTEAFSDREEVYYTQVTALLEGQASQPAHPSSPFKHGFCPARDTYLDLPLLTVTPCEKNLCLDLQPPMEHLRDFYESVQYELRIESSSGTNKLETKFLRRQILENLVPGRRYCVSICFSDSMLPRKSNYSKPVCASTKDHKTADPVISSVLCLLVLLGLAVVAFLVSAGYVCLRKRRLPLVLTSIHHLEEVLVAAPSSVSLSSLMNLKPTAPSAGAKRCSQTSSDDSDESDTEEPGDSGGGRCYNLRVGADFSSSSSSQTSSSAPPPPEAEPRLSSSSEPPSDLVSTQTLGQTATETHPASRLNDTLSSHTHSPSHQQDSDPPAGGAKPKEEQVEGEEGSQNVNLLTLTFGRHEEVEDEEEEKLEEEQEKLLHAEPPSASEEQNTTANLLTQARDNKEAAGETASCSDEEDEEEEEEEEEEEDDEEEDSGYIRR